MRFANSAARWALGAFAILTITGCASGGGYESRPAAASADRRVRIINETGYTIVHFYGSNVGRNSWEEDILGRDTLSPGQSVMINFDDGSGHCQFDFKAVFSDGDEATKRGVNVCQITSFRFTE